MSTERDKVVPDPITEDAEALGVHWTSSRGVWQSQPPRLSEPARRTSRAAAAMQHALPEVPNAGDPGYMPRR